VKPEIPRRQQRPTLGLTGVSKSLTFGKATSSAPDEVFANNADESGTEQRKAGQLRLSSSFKTSQILPVRLRSTTLTQYDFRRTGERERNIFLSDESEGA
jgi:hypothetical protein